ncbi:fluoride efflux transporter CrcB (plasmid) [Adhaeribacter swui]|uniref:Fluoride-specific ion channel FluC n=1 Tax=Adhaeribacter swui TaxID=2086471 RepID=A0A7G7G215_9BACT|nr:fluoride efflux transporter CrcB [Adhaeribacter swui]QNF31199.1 fluoride efflux transporter CrcB [Adhaeribacter swui]
MRFLLIVFMGGGLGSIARYLVNKWVGGTLTSVYPYGTFLVNIIGCFLIGFLIFFTQRAGASTIFWRLFLVTGFCGGFTTFSSFTFENVELIGNQQLLLFFVYATGSVVLGLLATYLGILAARNI